MTKRRPTPFCGVGVDDRLIFCVKSDEDILAAAEGPREAIQIGKQQIAGGGAIIDLQSAQRQITVVKKLTHMA